MQLTLPTIIQDTHARVHTQSLRAFDTVKVRELVFDTRKVQFVDDALFLCLAKNKTDILHHIKKAEEKDIKIFLVPEGLVLPKSRSIFLVVENVIDAVQKIAIAHRNRFECKVVGITGSNGKTIIKEWLSQLLEMQFHVTKSPASFNSQLGVPLSVLGLHEETDFGIFEAGISEVNEMQKLQPIIDCDLGILTNIGDAHEAGFQNNHEKLVQKLQLFRNASKLIFEEEGELTKPVISHVVKCELINWSMSTSHADYFVKVDKNPDFTLIHISQKHELTVIFYLSDLASIKNVIHVIIAGLELGLHPSYIIDKVKYLEAVSMRLVMKKALRNCIVIDDSYNADLASLENALDFAHEQKKHRLLHLILTEFDQIRQDETYFQRLSAIISKYDIHHLSYIGHTQPVLIHSSKISYYETPELLKIELEENPPENEAILIKGARRFRLDRLIADMRSKSHRTELIISLDDIKNNIKHFRSLIPSKTKIMAVIKAGAYGSDSVTLAKHLLRCGIEYLGVAYYDEGLELRKEGISAPMMIMNPDPQLTYLAEQNNLELEVYSLDQMNRILSTVSHKLKLHLKIDSGMHRLGLVYDDLPALKKIIEDNDHIEIKSIFSHFSSAEDEGEDDFTKVQNSYFLRCYDFLIGEQIKTDDLFQAASLPTLKHIPKHICNSNATMRFPQYHYDMVRLGIGLYGYLKNGHLVLAHKLKTYVAQVKSVKKGESVGYNRNFIADKDIKVATLCIGYADGISRKLGHGKASFTLQGKEVSTVGNISMDTCSVDVTDMFVRAGEEVIIYDSVEKFNQLIAVSEKSAYEFISGIGSRVVRSYEKE